tara:strand:- start:117 stop:440 length:324 start_codon:yes stop_codon:yes gene_type:complete
MKRLFNPTYAIICNQGTEFNSSICMTKNEIIDYYEEFAHNDLYEEDYENYWKKYKSLEYISENWEVIIFKSNKSWEELRDDDWRKAREMLKRKKDIFGCNVFESYRY